MALWKKTAGAVLAVATSALLLSACGGGSTTPTATNTGSGSSTTSSGQTLELSILSTGDSKIPAFTTTGEDTQIMNQIYGSLLQVKPGTSQLVPSLATSYKATNNAQTWTFQLRKGVKWAQGYGDFTCADVKFTWDFNKNPANKSFWQTDAEVVKSVSCPNPYEAVFQLNAPDLSFGWAVANIEPSTGWIMSQKAWNKLGKSGYDKNPIGTGPYEMAQLVPNDKVVLKANPDYWGPKPKVKKIVFKMITNYQTAALAVKTGSLDIAQIDPVTAAQYKNSTTSHIVVLPAMHCDWLEINTKLPPFNNVLVRRAMRAAIDYKAIVNDVYRGDASPGYEGLINKGQIGFNASVSPQNTYNPQLAKKLLQQSGVKLPITGFFTTYNDTADTNTAQLIQADLAKVGIDLKARPLERGTLVQVRVKPTTPATIIGSTFTPNPNFLLNLTFLSSNIPPAGLNTARYSGIDKLYQEQVSATTTAQRDQYLTEIQKKLAADVPAIMIQASDNVYIVNNKVKDYYPTPYFSGDPLRLVSLSK